jgi:hypothetical protein
MGKRIVHVEIDERTFAGVDGLNSGLRGLAEKAADSCDFEDILNNALRLLYQNLPEGQKNYSIEKPLIGHVWLCRFNNNSFGCADITYNPSGKYEEKFRYVQRGIGIVNLRERTYTSSWEKGNYDEDYDQIPRTLMIDTEKVMEEGLGLKKKAE